METNYDHYLGSPERASHTLVTGYSWPFHIQVSTITHTSMQVGSYQLIAELDSVGSYLEWLQSPYDDGTIIWDD